MNVSATGLLLNVWLPNLCVTPAQAPCKPHQSLQNRDMSSTAKCLLALALTTQLGCSVYQSEGRKFLEEQAFDFALQGTSLTALQVEPPCAEVKDLTDELIEEHWSWSHQESEAVEVSIWHLKQGFGALLTLATEGTSQVVCDLEYPDQEAFKNNSQLDRERSLQIMHRLYVNSGNF
jgi:hypothetical protein